jgi:hypothetical protein
MERPRRRGKAFVKAPAEGGSSVSSVREASRGNLRRFGDVSGTIKSMRGSNVDLLSEIQRYGDEINHDISC